MPTRRHTAEIAIASVLSQVDRLWLVLDGFDEVPDFARHPKIIVEHGRDHGGLKAEGKYLGLALDDDATVYMSADDDIIYPPDYVSRLARYCRLMPGRVAAGCHGSIFQRPVTSYVTDRKVRVSHHKQSTPWRSVDVLATNGTVHLTRDMRFDVRTWTYRNQVDLNFLEEAIAHNVRFVLGQRVDKWVRQLDRDQDDSIFRSLSQDDSVQTGRINDLLARRKRGLRRFISSPNGSARTSPSSRSTSGAAGTTRP